MQSEQAVLPVAPTFVVYFPAGQSMHAELPEVEVYFPTGQAVQIISADVVQAVAINLPAAQALLQMDEQEVAPNTELNLPIFITVKKY